jgi:bidirectional [NiFe] hydrogenase diaphorase subunit
MPKLLIDDKEIEVDEGTTLLQACLDNAIYIPNLCFIQGMRYPLSLCRLCFVEIEGMHQPVPSCTIQVREGMVVQTDTPAVRQLQRTALRLLLSVHDVDCKNCHANKNCELQNIARFLKVGLKPKPLERYLKETDVDESHPFIIHYPNRCVLCGKCYYICREQNGQAILTFAKRGFDTQISFYGQNDGSKLECEVCNTCVKVCPVGALALKEPGVHP